MASAITAPRQEIFNLATSEKSLSSWTKEDLTKVFDRLKTAEKKAAYCLRAELAQRDELPYCGGESWGKENFWQDSHKAAQVMHRMGLLGDMGIFKITYTQITLLQAEDEHGKIKHNPPAFHYCLSEKMGKDPQSGRIGYVNGMATEPWMAGLDAAKISDMFASGYNIHGIFVPTRVEGKGVKDIAGIMKYVEIDGNGYTRASCLIVQQWIDYLKANPNKYFLQVCTSAGAAHVDAALAILRDAKPKIAKRLRILVLAPAKCIIPKWAEGQDHFLQVINVYKQFDIVSARARGFELSSDLSYSPIFHYVHHQDGQYPHFYTSPDFVREAKPLFDSFIAEGSLYSSQANTSDDSDQSLRLDSSQESGYSSDCCALDPSPDSPNPVLYEDTSPEEISVGSDTNPSSSENDEFTHLLSTDDEIWNEISLTDGV